MRTNLNIAVLATVSAVALAGCGSSSDSNSPSANANPTTATAPDTATTSPDTSSSASTPAKTTASTPNGIWANQLCSALTGKIKPIQPPTVQSTSPSDTQKSLVTFISSVVDTEGLQLETMKSVGPPPGSAGKKDWNAAIDRLTGIRKKLAKVERGLKATNPTDAKQLQAVVTDLGTKLKVLSTYQGPVVDLSTTKSVGKAITADPGCQSLA